MQMQLLQKEEGDSSIESIFNSQWKDAYFDNSF